MEISYRHHGNHLVFERSADAIRLLGLFTETIWRTKDLQSGSIIQMQLSGEAESLNSQARGIRSLPGERMQFVSMLKDERYHGDLIIIIMKDPVTGVLAEVNYLLCSESPTIRTWVRVRNDSDRSVRLERVYSAILYNLAIGGLRPWNEKTYVHLWYDAEWYEAGQWHRLGLKELGLWRTPYLGISRAWQISSGLRYNQHLPMAMLEDIETKTVWYWQIEHFGSWHWEIGADQNNQLYFLAGGPDGCHHGWCKELKPGEAFHTMPMAFGCVQGCSEEALAALTRYHKNLVSGAAPESCCQFVSY